MGWVGVVQHGPVQCLNFFLSFDVLKPEHLTWSQFSHFEHWIDIAATLLVQMEQYQTRLSGPGFCSMPAISKSSRIRHAGVALFFVNQIKNTG